MVQQEKKLVDSVSGWLRVFDDGSVDRAFTGPPEAKFMSEPVPPHDHFVDSVSVRDVLTDPATGLGLRLRLYLPETTPGGPGFPVILHFHGGGFCISQADWRIYYSVYSRLAGLSGAAVASVFLRLAPEHRLPAAANDAFSALLWLRSHPLPGSDPARTFLLGDSSGGNLVHHVAARAGQAGIPLAGAVPIHPGFTRPQRSLSEARNPETPFLTLEMADKFLAMALPAGSTKDHPMTCPMDNPVTGPMPPVMLCLAERDLFWDTEMEYYEAMKKADHDIELFLSPGMTHSFYLNKIAVDNDPDTAEQTRRLFTAIVEFIKRH